MTEDPANFIECAVCGRNILRGERVADYVTPEREQVSVCALCKTRAEQMGWTQATLASMPAASESPRRRAFDLRGRLRGALGPRRGRGMTADELAREIGIPDPPRSDRGPEDPEFEPEDEREFVIPDDEDEDTRFPEPVGSRRDDSGPDLEPEPIDPDTDEDPHATDEEQRLEHGLSEPESFWDDRARSTGERPEDDLPDEPAETEQPAGRPPAREPRPSQSRRRSPRSARRPAAEPEASPRVAEPPRRQPRTPARLMRTAAENFNASDESRKVGGLMRSLGEPSVSLRPPAREDLPALLTVAWELSWYQWEVGVESDDDSVREIAKGSEISELDDAATRWNARADEDGLIRLRRASRGESED